MRADPANPRWAASLLTAGAALVLGYFAFVERRVPLFGWADAGPELRHLLLCGRARLHHGDDGKRLADADATVRVPWLCARPRRLAGRGVLPHLGGHDAQDASVYIADAQLQALPLLFGGGTLDWGTSSGRNNSTRSTAPER